jgi:hypothetical protein
MANGRFPVRERNVKMRTMVGFSAVVLMLVVLSSCSGNRPERAFMGTWKGTAEGEAIELSFMEKDVCIVKSNDKSNDETIAGTWSIDPEDKAVMIFEDENNKVKVIATLLKDGKMIAQKEDESEAVVFEKSDSKKK